MRDLAGETKKKSKVGKIIVLSLLFAFAIFLALRLFNLEKLVFRGPQTVVRLITDTGLKSDRARTNVLLLGIGGAGHEGPNLSDTMILASIDREGKDVVLISIPRDLWAADLSAKINSAYAYGEDKNGQGLELASETVSKTLGLPIHYAVRLDFNGFIEAVNLVGGLDIDVENTFTDTKYPIADREDDLCGLSIENQEIDGTLTQVVKDATGAAMPLSQINDQNNPFVCRYESITFKKGPLHLDGQSALKFVRSRYGTNGEGSDFARSARQQKVLVAFRTEVLSGETLLNPKTVIDLVRTFGASIDTNISDEDTPLFVKLATKIEPATVRRMVLDSTNDSSLLEVGNAQNYKGQFVLIAKGNDWVNLARRIESEVFPQKN